MEGGKINETLEFWNTKSKIFVNSFFLTLNFWLSLTYKTCPRFRETISFYHIDPVQFSEDTPLKGFFQSGRLDKSMNK